METATLATAQQVAEFLGVTPGSLAQMRYLGKGPAFIKVSGRRVRYRWSEVNRWLDSRSATSTARAAS